MFCSNCGGSSSEGSKFCATCGSGISGSNVATLERERIDVDIIATEGSREVVKNENEIVNQYEPTVTKINTPSADKIGENYISTLRQLVGKNAEHYLEQFAKLENNQKAKFSWPALLAGQFFFAYRKMHREFFIVLVGSLLTFIPLLGWMMGLGIFIYMAVNANDLYYKSINKKLEKSKLQGKDVNEEPQISSQLEKIGGVSWAQVVVTVFATWLLYGFLSGLIAGATQANISNNLDTGTNSRPAVVQQNNDAVKVPEKVPEKAPVNNTQKIEADEVTLIKNIFSGLPDEGVQVSTKSENFIKSNLSLFPAKNEADKTKLYSFVDPKIEYKHLIKDIEPFQDKIIKVRGYVVQVSQEKIDENRVFNYGLVVTAGGEHFMFMHKDKTNIFAKDFVELVGLPINPNSYNNTKGGVTHSIVVLSGDIKKITIGNE